MSADVTGPTGPIYLPYTLRLHSPAIVARPSGDPNSAATEAFIPGGAVRGALAARLLARSGALDEHAFRRLILTGEVRFLHAYPEIAGGRSRPAPKSWRVDKTERTRAHDLAFYTGSGSDWPDTTLSSAIPPFASALGSQCRVMSPRTGSRVHQQRDRIKGRSWRDKGNSEKAHGAIFVYEYLEPDQIFHGVIQVMPQARAEILCIQNLLGGQRILVGRSRRAGYGGDAAIEFAGITTNNEYEQPSGWLSADLKVGDLFMVLLTSAYIGRDARNGQIDPSALREELRSQLGESAEVERTRWAFETVGSFNQKWRLPTPGAQAVAPGSVLVLRATRDIESKTFRAIEHEGLGERRVEGFGRVLFLEYNDAVKASFRLTYPDNREGIGGTGKLEGEPATASTEPLRFLEQRIVLAAARAELNRVATLDLAQRAQEIPTNSLLGRLRTLFRGVTTEEAASIALGSLGVWCSDDSPRALKQKARDQLTRCRIAEDGLLSWLGRLAVQERGEGGWKALVEASGSGRAALGKLARATHLKSETEAAAALHAHSALLRVHLIDALLAALARRNRRAKR